MMRIYGVVICVALLLSACNLSGGRVEDEPEQPLVLRENTPDATLLSSETNDAQATEEPASNPVTTSGSTSTSSTTNTSSSSSSTTSSNTASSASSAAPQYVVSLPAPYAACSVVPNGNFTVNIRQFPTTSSAVMGILNKVSWVKVAKLQGEWYQVDYPGTPVHQMWVAAGVVTLQPPCLCTPDCIQTDHAPADSPNLACRIEVINTTDVYDTPGNWGNKVGQFPQGLMVAVNALASNGWLGVAYFPDGRATYAAPNYVRLLGDCNRVSHIIAQPTLGACFVTNFSGTPQTLRTTPEMLDTNYFGRFPPSSTMYVLRKQGDWYQVYVEPFSAAAWIPANVVTPNPECGTQPLPFDALPQ